ncbi:MAG: hypothetical protein HYX41_04585 [Bdellovibrio sp.]|nr:hypothetical protein [Bdellovibrio sp.]
MTGFIPEALGLLESHSWPGNVRELENVIERTVLTAKTNMISAADIYIERREGRLSHAGLAGQDLDAQGLVQGGSVLAGSANGQDKNWLPGRTLDDIERNVIIEALKYHHGNRTHTARALGISIRTLRNKIADYRRLGIHL